MKVAVREDHLALLKAQFGEYKIAQSLDVLTAYSQLIAPSLIRLNDLDRLIRVNQIEAAKIQRQKYQQQGPAGIVELTDCKPDDIIRESKQWLAARIPEFAELLENLNETRKDEPGR